MKPRLLQPGCTSSESIKCVLTRSKVESEFLGLDLSDFLWLWFIGFDPRNLFAIGHTLVCEDPLLAGWILNLRIITAPVF